MPLVLLAVLTVLIRPTDARRSTQLAFRVNGNTGNTCELATTARLPITNESVCRSFADSGQNGSIVYRHSVTLPDAPPGCFVFQNPSTRPQLEPFNGVYFNLNTTGGSRNAHTMVCVLASYPQGAPPPPPDQRIWPDDVQFCEGPDNGRLAFQEAMPFDLEDACLLDPENATQTERCKAFGWAVFHQTGGDGNVCKKVSGSAAASFSAADCTEVVGGTWQDNTCLDAAIDLSGYLAQVPNVMEDLCTMDLSLQRAVEMVSTICCVPETPLYRCGPPPPPLIRFCTGDHDGYDHFIDTNFPAMEMGDCVIPADGGGQCVRGGFVQDGSTCDTNQPDGQPPGPDMNTSACTGVGGTWSPTDCRQLQIGFADFIQRASVEDVCQNPSFLDYMRAISEGCCEHGYAYEAFDGLCSSTVAPAVTNPPDQNMGFFDIMYYNQGGNCADNATIVELQFPFSVGQSCVPFPENTPLDWTVASGVGETSVSGSYMQIAPCTPPGSMGGGVHGVALTGSICTAGCTSCLETFSNPIEAADVRGVCTDNPLAPTVQQYVVVSYRSACPVAGVPTPEPRPAPPTMPQNHLAPRFCTGSNNGLDNFHPETPLDIEDACVINGTYPRQLAACNAHFQVDPATGFCIENGRVPMSAHSCETMVGGKWVEKTCADGADHAIRFSATELDGVCDSDDSSRLFSTVSSVCCSPGTGYYRCGPPPPPPLRFCTGDHYGDDNFIDTNFPVNEAVQCTIPNGVNATAERAACIAAGFEINHGTRCRTKQEQGNPQYTHASAHMNASVCSQIGGTFTVSDCQQQQVGLFDDFVANNLDICIGGFYGGYLATLSRDCCANGTAADAFSALCGGPNATVEPFTRPADPTLGYFAMEFFLLAGCRGRPDVALSFSFAPGETCVKFPDNTPEAWITVEGAIARDSYMRISTCDAAGSIAVHAVFCNEGCSFCEYNYVQKRGAPLRLSDAALECQRALVPGNPMFRFTHLQSACSQPGLVTVAPPTAATTTAAPTTASSNGPNNEPNTGPGGMGMGGPHPPAAAASGGITEASVIAIVAGVVVVALIAALVSFYYVKTRYGGDAQPTFVNPNFGGQDPAAYNSPSVHVQSSYEDDGDVDMVRFA